MIFSVRESIWTTKDLVAFLRVICQMVVPPDLMYLPETSAEVQSKFLGQRFVAIAMALSKSIPSPLSLTKVFREGILLSGVR